MLNLMAGGRTLKLGHYISSLDRLNSFFNRYASRLEGQPIISEPIDPPSADGNGVEVVPMVEPSSPKEEVRCKP